MKLRSFDGNHLAQHRMVARSWPRLSNCPIATFKRNPALWLHSCFNGYASDSYKNKFLAADSARLITGRVIAQEAFGKIVDGRRGVT